MVQASHLAISSPALLSFVRAYLWQLERTGKVPDSEDAGADVLVEGLSG